MSVLDDGGGSVAPTVSPVSTNIIRTRGSTCYAQVEYHSDGTEAACSNLGANNYALDRGNWLDTGLAEDVWVEATVNSGSLTFGTTGSRLQLNTTRTFGNIDTTDNSPNNETGNVTFEFWDAATGGNSLGSATFTITADRNTL